MSSIKWFEGDSKEALQLMVERNCAFLVYIGKENDDLTKALSDPTIIKLLNNQLILCYKMDPTSPSLTNFKDIFNSVVVPSIYLLEKNNIQQLIIKKPEFIMSNEIQLDLKRQLLNGIHCTIKYISDTINDDDLKQNHIQYLTEITNKLQILDSSIIKESCQKDAEEIKKLNSKTRIKIKIPCVQIANVEEFQSNSTLNDVKTFVLDNFYLPKGSIKFIAHKQFVEEDFCQSLEALNLTPSSTIYVHIVPSDQWLPSILNFQSWLFNIITFTIINPYNFLLYHIMNFIGRPSPVNITETPRTSNRQNESQTKKPSTSYKPVSNIHRLRTNESDDDENNTYNGNSTQQL